MYFCSPLLVLHVPLSHSGYCHHNILLTVHIQKVALFTVQFRAAVSYFPPFSTRVLSTYIFSLRTYETFC